MTVCILSSWSMCSCVGYQCLKSLWSFWFWWDLSCEEVVIPVSWIIMHSYAAAFLNLLNCDSQNHPKAVLALLTYVCVAGKGLFLIVRGFGRMKKARALWKFLREHVMLCLSQSVSEAGWAHSSSVVPELIRNIFLTWASYKTLCHAFRFVSMV